MEKEAGKVLPLEGNVDHSTTSSEEEQVKTPSLRMIASQQLTPVMAVNYLFQWRHDSKLVEPLLSRIHQLCVAQHANYIPTIIYIMSLENNEHFEVFCERVAAISLAHYLLLRWSYSTYMATAPKLSQVMCSRLDASLERRYAEHSNHSNSEDNEAIMLRCRQKELFSNYLLYTNDFFERLFRIPQKLKEHEKPNRNKQLQRGLNRIFDKFTRHRNEYMKGVPFPIAQKSNIMVKILTPYCFTFSTKERVPFKIVIQTISAEEALQFQANQISIFLEQKCNDQLPPNPTPPPPRQQSSLILPVSYFGRNWSEEREVIEKTSHFSHCPNYQIRCFMVKSGDDLRQEHMAMQLINLIRDIAEKQNLKIWLRPYTVIPFNGSSGLIEFISDTKTVSYLKEISKERSLITIYRQLFGSNVESAVLNFIESLAGYSLLQYLFQIKDRHNNNILIDSNGHLIHIDFSFMLSSSPGNMGFERAPFKLTPDYIEMMEGLESDIFRHFKMLFMLGLKYVAKYKREIMETIMMMTHCSDLKCFQYFDQERFEKKFHEQATDEDLELIVERIISQAVNSYSTMHYDMYQWYTNEIYA